MPEPFFDIGTTISIPKDDLDLIIAALEGMGFDVVGPQVKDHTIIHGPLQHKSDLPVGFRSQQKNGSYRLIKTTESNHFDYANGPHSWKQYFFPPKSELM